MTEAQTFLSDSQAEAGSLDATPDNPPGLVSGVYGESCGGSGIENGADLGGRTLLSRAPAPQGRRSLFRR